MRKAKNNNGLRRRDFLTTGLALATGGAVISVTEEATGAPAVVAMQPGWIGGGNQIGEIAAF